jgi:type VI secretion system secreted protein VgrG
MPATYSQAGRLMALTTPLGADKLLLEKLTGFEAISELFRFDLDVLAPQTDPLAFDKLLGQSATVAIQLPDGSSRYLNGIVRRLSEGARVPGPLGEATFLRYHLELVPKLWLLTLRSQSRIFQQVSVPDILKQVLTGIDVSWQIQGSFEPRDYCTQYQESDFAFASRVMEEEGIYYYFQHADGSHKMVVANTPQSHAVVPGPATVSYQPRAGGLHPDDRIFVWSKAQEIRPGKVTLRDHTFELPSQNLEAKVPLPESVSAGSVVHKLKLGSNGALEVYKYPGGYATRFDGVDPGGGDRSSDVQKIFSDGDRTAHVRMQQEACPALVVEGEGNVRHLSAGHKFTLADHFDADGDYALTRVEHEISLAGVYTGGGMSEGAHACRFRCIPLAMPFVPPLVTPRPKVAGPQRAVVVGPAGGEIFTDKYGRVKVQFFWDRDGKKDAGSSCWVRVAQPWAGSQWGGVWIPRVGHEVLIAFVEGDPGRPLVVGSVYNAENMPPYALPDNMTQSGIKSRSTPEGTADNFNELRFEDKKGSEEVYFHAEKDFNRVVENNDTLKVGFQKKDKGDQTVEIFNNHSLTVGAGKDQAAEGSQTLSVYKDRTATIETGNESLTVKQGDRAVTVSTGNDTHKVEQGNRNVEIAMGDDTLTIKNGNRTTKLDLGSSTTEAMQAITLKVGQNSIKIDQSGITLSGMAIKVTGQVQVQVQAPIAQVSADGMLQLKGGVTMIN